MGTSELRWSYWILTVIGALVVLSVVKLQLHTESYNFIFVSHGTPVSHQQSPSKQISGKERSTAWRQQHTSLNMRSSPSVTEQGTPKRQCGSKGYVMALSYHDQVTCATGRMAVLQCWAHTYGMSVVEPFLPSNSSFIGMPNPGEPVSQSLRFSDLFDIDKWNHVHAYKSNRQTLQFSPTTTWEEFISCAPREVIIVQIIHKVKEHFSYPCTYPRVQTHWESVFAPHRFRIVKWVCINMADYGLLSLEAFKERVFGIIDSRRVTLIFDQWRGIHNHMSTYASNLSITMASPCTNQAVRNAVLKYVTPSEKVLADAKKYEEQFLGSQSYRSVMIRLERVISCSPDHGPEYIKRIRSFLSELRHNSSTPVFLSTDTGTYGSQSFSDHSISPHLLTNYSEIVLDSLYEGKAMNIEEYEQRFTNISYSLKPAYISTLQKALASRGQCVYMFGGGGFQLQAEVWHKLLYHRKHKCVYSLDRRLCSIRNTLSPWQTWIAD